MSGFGHYERDAEELEREIVKRGIVLGLDWQDENQMRELAREALTTSGQATMAELRSDDLQGRARFELFGLAALMLETMRQSAEIGVHTHGGPAWKAFGHALIVESQRLGGEATH